MKLLKKTVFAALVAVMLVGLMSCDSKKDKAIKIIKSGELNDYPGITIGKVAEDFFISPSYDAFEVFDGWHVNLSGEVDWNALAKKMVGVVKSELKGDTIEEISDIEMEEFLDNFISEMEEESGDYVTMKFRVNLESGVFQLNAIESNRIEMAWDDSEVEYLLRLMFEPDNMIREMLNEMLD